MKLRNAISATDSGMPDGQEPLFCVQEWGGVGLMVMWIPFYLLSHLEDKGIKTVNHG